MEENKQYTLCDLGVMESEVSKLAENWSTEIACYKAIGKAVRTRNDDAARQWIDVLTFRKLHLLPNPCYFRLDDFNDYGVPERTLDLRKVFAQCALMYPDFLTFLKSAATIAGQKKEIRKHNAEMNQTLMNLDNTYPSVRDFVNALRNAIDHRACINFGSAKITAYTWAPGTNRRFRTSTKLYTMDSRKTPMTAETLKVAADTILESCGTGW